MESAAPLLLGAVLIPILLGFTGLLLLRTRRRSGISLVGAAILAAGLIVMFAVG